MKRRAMGAKGRPCAALRDCGSIFSAPGMQPYFTTSTPFMPAMQ
jgi:hypothetical protein